MNSKIHDFLGDGGCIQKSLVKRNIDSCKKRFKKLTKWR